MLNLSSVANWLGEKLEDKDGFVPKTMLCLPIYNGQRDVIGVAQLINKVGLPSLYKPFNKRHNCARAIGGSIPGATL